MVNTVNIFSKLFRNPFSGNGNLLVSRPTESFSILIPDLFHIMEKSFTISETVH
jgi:hypothetical protein